MAHTPKPIRRAQSPVLLPGEGAAQSHDTVHRNPQGDSAHKGGEELRTLVC